jgi:hypothetical protein
VTDIRWRDRRVHTSHIFDVYKSAPEARNTEKERSNLCPNQAALPRDRLRVVVCTVCRAVIFDSIKVQGWPGGIHSMDLDLIPGKSKRTRDV